MTQLNRDVAKYYGDVPGWHYWFERRRQLWHAERPSKPGCRRLFIHPTVRQVGLT